MRRTTKSIFALIIVLVMCVSFCVPTFAEVAAVAEANTDVATCPLAGKTHTLEAFGLDGDKWTDDNGKVAVYKVVNPNCEDGGHTIYECLICDDVKFVDSWVEPGEGSHAWADPVVTTEPDCTNPGVGTKECTKCGKIAPADLPALGHDYDADNDGKIDWVVYDVATGEAITDYTCGQAGVDMKADCAACDHVGTYKEITGEDFSTGEHDWVITFEGTVDGEELKKPTCVADGLAYYDCKNCSVEGVKAVPKLSAADPAAHNWLYAAEDYQAPTCAVDGWIKNAVCKDCKVEMDVVIPATGDHDWQDATCTAPKTCKTCGLVDENSPALDHNFKDFKVEADGTIVKPNNIINVVIKETASCKGEFWYCANKACDNRNEEKAAGDCVKCGEALAYDDGGIGHVYFECTECGLKDIHKELARTEHPEFEETKQNPTCTEWGFEAKACLACGDYEYFKMIPPYSHNPYKGNTEKLEKVEAEWVAPSCDDDGVEVWLCTACNTKIEIEVPKYNHGTKTYEHTELPTCAKKGYTETRCEFCDKAIVDVVENDDEFGRYEYTDINPDNHNKITKWTTHPTCTATGLALTFCQDCSWVDRDANNDYNYVTVPALGHDATEWNKMYPDNKKNGKTFVTDEPIAPTCTEDGYHEWTCDLCNKNDGVDKTADKLGHNYVKYDEDGELTQWVLDEIEATCEDYGYTVIQCSRCTVVNTDNGITEAPEGMRTWFYKPGSFEIQDNPYGEDFYVAPYGHNYDNFQNLTAAELELEEYPKCIDNPNTEWDETVGKLWAYCEHGCGTKDFTASDREFDINNTKSHVNYERDKAKDHRPATCVKTGIEYYLCDDCDKDFSVILPLTSHTPGTIVPGDAPECLVDGKAPHYICTFVDDEGNKCGATVYVYDNGTEVPADKLADYLAEYKAFGSHDMADATCTAPATCKRGGCGYTEGEALGHNMAAATCTAPATCVREGCGYTEGVKIDHKYSDGSSAIVITTVPVTCTTDGYVYSYCAICNASWEIKNYKYALDHDFSVLVSDECIAPTCTTPGQNVYKCSRCDETDTEVLPALTDDLQHVNAAGDKFGDKCVIGFNEEDYICTKSGCGHTWVDVQHNYSVYGVSADCTERCYELVLCLDCKHDDVVDYGKNEYHSWGNNPEAGWEIDTEATLTTPGTRHRDCQNVGCSYSENGTYEHAAGAEFDFEITNLRGEKQDVYAGRIKLVIRITAKESAVKNLSLRIGFNNEVLSFVKGNLVVQNMFSENNDTAFQTAATANEISSVGIYVSAPNDKVVADLGDEQFVFAELEFDIKNTKKGGEDINFWVENAIAYKLDDNANDVSENLIYPEAVDMPSSETIVLGKLTTDGHLANEKDAAALLDMIKSTDDVYLAEADFNKDGKVDGLDYAAMRRYLLKDQDDLAG